MSAESTAAAPALDLFGRLRAGLRPRGTAPLVRLFMRESSYVDVDFVQKAVDMAQSRCAMVAAGLDELNQLETLALQLLCDSAYIERAK